MTTSIFYPSSTGGFLQRGDANTTAARALTREATQAATIAERIFASGSGSTTMTSGTFTNTPAPGDILIAVLARRADGQASITNPTGWTLLTAGATGGSRSLEVWWYRSTGVVGDKGSFAWTVTSATGAWGIELICFGGSAAYADPTLKVASTSFTSTTTPVARTATPDTNTDAPGMTLTCIATTGASLGASGITAAFSGTGTAEATTNYYDSTYGGMATTVHDLYSNVAYGSPTFGTAYTLSASRAGHQAVIHLSGGGASFETGPGLGAGIGGTSFPGAMMQTYLRYDTSSIPDSNTVTSATLGLRATGSVGGGGVSANTDPANAALQARYYGTSITNTRGNNNSAWVMSPTSIATKTLVASYPASSSWGSTNSYTLTSNSAFPSSINLTGDTVLVLTTDDFATSTARTTRELYAFDVSGALAPLTVVHYFAATATATATAGTTPTLTGIGTFARTVLATIQTTPTVTRTIATVRTVTATITSGPAIGRTLSILRTITASIVAVPATLSQRGTIRTIAATTNVAPVITRTATYLRTITATITTVPRFTIRQAIRRTITATTSLIGTIAGGRLVPQPPRILRLAVRRTVTIGQTVTARLIARGTLRLPKENQ
jgi:hypothetical protein